MTEKTTTILTMEELTRLRNESGQWPHVWHQDKFSAYESVCVTFIPQEFIQSMMRDKFTDGAYLIHYRGGGITVHLRHDETDLLARVLRASASNHDWFWSEVLGRDITQPYVVHDRSEKKKSSAKRPTDQLSLEDLGL